MKRLIVVLFILLSSPVYADFYGQYVWQSGYGDVDIWIGQVDSYDVAALYQNFEIVGYANLNVISYSIGGGIASTGTGILYEWAATKYYPIGKATFNNIPSYYIGSSIVPESWSFKYEPYLSSQETFTNDILPYTRYPGVSAITPNKTLLSCLIASNGDISECILDSHRPDTPVIVQISGDVPLRDQIFDVYGFGDPDQSDYLSASEWQLSTDQNFNQNNIVLQRILERRTDAAYDAIEHRQLLMPQAILIKANTYWIRTRHRDSVGLWSEWSNPVSFATIADDPDDSDNNGIDDAYQVPGDTDTNNNGIDDNQENIYALYDAEEGDVIGVHTDNGTLGVLNAIPNDEIAAELMPEYPMSSGLFSFRIDGLPVDANNPALVDVTFYFSEPLPSNTKWYKYDPVNDTMTDFTSNLAINGNRAVLALTDGGPGDVDGVVNGIIVDPSGAAVPSTPEPPSNGGGGGGGCFITTVAP